MARINFRKGLAIEWYNKNPILGSGEPGYESDTGLMKIGDGVSRYTELEYFYPGRIEMAEQLQTHINDSTPHPVYDDGPSLVLIYQNKKV